MTRDATPELERLPHSVTLTLAGKKGTRSDVRHEPYCLFKVDQIAATDSLGGRGSRVHGVFIGCTIQHPMETPEERDTFFALDRGGVLSAKFSIERLGRRALDACPDLVTMTVNVSFVEDCEIAVTLSGEAWKRPGDTREDLRTRALASYEAQELARYPNAPEEYRRKLREMLRRMPP